PAGWSSRSHAATCHGGSDAATEIDCRTPVCRAEIPDLWASAISAAWAQRSANGDQFGSHGLQLETDDQRSRRGIAGGKACASLKSLSILGFCCSGHFKDYISALPANGVQSFVTASSALGLAGQRQCKCQGTNFYSCRSSLAIASPSITPVLLHNRLKVNGCDLSTGGRSDFALCWDCRRNELSVASHT